jgi:hypothetical protein
MFSNVRNRTDTRFPKAVGLHSQRATYQYLTITVLVRPHALHSNVRFS